VYQEYIDGTEFSVECYAQNGIAQVLGMHQKTSMQLPFFMETGDIVPPQVSPDVRLQLEEESKKALVALGVTDSVAHVEIKLASRGPQVIEVASRMGGDYTWHNIRSIYNADLVQIACDIALGINVPEKAYNASGVLLGHFFIPSESGAIVSITGADAFANNPDVTMFFSGRAGDAIRVPPDGFDSVGWVCVQGNTLAYAEQLLELVKRTVVMDVAPPNGRRPAMVAPSFVSPLFPT
jgi:ATP-grasp domain/L-amino acid ligase C-terminal domain 2